MVNLFKEVSAIALEVGITFYDLLLLLSIATFY